MDLTVYLKEDVHISVVLQCRFVALMSVMRESFPRLYESVIGGLTY